MDRERLWTVAAAIYRETREENLTFMAGSIAYHAFVSLLPLVVLLVVTLESVGNQTLVDRIFALTESVLTAGGRDAITESLGAGRRVSGVSLLGAVILAWATLRIFRGLDQAFSEIYGTDEFNTVFDQVVDGTTVLLVVVSAVVTTAALRDRLVFVGPVGELLQTAFVVGALTVVFLPMYYLFPDTNLRVVEALPGTVFAAVGVTALESLFRLYVSLSSTTKYGVLGGMVVLVTWLYFVGLVVLLGATVNAVLTNRTAGVQIDPVIGNYRPGDWGDARDLSPAALASRLDELRWRVVAETPVTITVSGKSETFPPPADVVVDANPDRNEVGITFRWENVSTAGASGADAGGETDGRGPTPGPGRGERRDRESSR